MNFLSILPKSLLLESSVYRIMFSAVEPIRASIIGELGPAWLYRADLVENKLKVDGSEIKIYILDTPFLLDLLQENKAAWCILFELEEDEAFLGISEASAHEFLKNAYLSQKSMRLGDIEEILKLLNVLPMTNDSYHILHALSTHISPKRLNYQDAVTAAIALDTNGTIVTRGKRFYLIPDLEVITY